MRGLPVGCDGRHSYVPVAKPPQAHALLCHSRTFEQQKQFVRQHFRLCQRGGTVKLNEAVPLRGLKGLDTRRAEWSLSGSSTAAFANGRPRSSPLATWAAISLTQARSRAGGSWTLNFEHRLGHRLSLSLMVHRRMPPIWLVEHYGARDFDETFENSLGLSSCVVVGLRSTCCIGPGYS